MIYERKGEEGQFMYHQITSILEPASLLPTMCERVSTPIANAMVERVLDYTSPLSLSPIVVLSLDEDPYAITGVKTEDQTQLSIQVV